MKLNNDLLDKYNIPVPRYTSYPPANHFNESLSQENYIELIKKSNSQEPSNIAFYIHIPFCDKICHYCGCNSILKAKGDLIKPYINALKKEIEIISQWIDKKRLVTQIHYGGGTPNSIDPNYISEINDIFFRNFNFIDSPEIAIETNPAHLDFDYIDKLKKSGFNRFSLGIQDFDEKILKTVNREPSKLPIKELVNYIKSENNIAINLDFIYGLPGQTVSSFAQTIDKAIEIKPDRLVTFSYAHIPWLKKYQTVLEKNGLPDANDKMGMFLEAYEALTTAGYKSIGMDHYVLPEDELNIALTNNQLHRNFQGYCSRRTTGQVYAFGVSSISQLTGGYSQNIKDIKSYIDSINNNILPIDKGYLLNDKEIIIKEIITNLMCNKKIIFSEISSRFNMTTNEIKSIIMFDENKLTEFIKDDLIQYSEDSIIISETGSLFIRNIAASLDPNFKQELNKYSKSV